MTRRRVLTVERLHGLLNAVGWDVQPNGRVLFAVRGVRPVLSADGTQALLPLRTGSRVVADYREAQALLSLCLEDGAGRGDGGVF